MSSHSHSHRGERGIVLISSLLLLLLVTIMALAMFRSFGLQERIAGNTREKQRALQAAEAAQQYAEYWLTSSGNAATVPVVCNALLDGNLNQGQICSNKLIDVVGGSPANIANMQWQVGGVDVGVTYKPPAMTVAAASITAWDNFAAKPRFYISDLGASADPTIPGEVYQIDAAGFGGNANAAAVVESTFAVYVTSRNTTL